MKTTRWRIIDGQMVEHPQGEYVLYADHRAARSRRTDELKEIRYNELLAHCAQLRRELEAMKERSVNA